MAGTLRKVLYFLGILQDADIEWIVRTGSRRSVRAGTVVIEEGKPIDSLFFILDGEFSVTSGRSSGLELARLAAGEMLGEMSFVDERPPSATVTAKMDSVIGVVPRSALEKKLAADVGFAARFYKSIAVLLSHRLRTVRTLNYGDEARVQPQDDDFELPSHLMDEISIAGNRFAQMQLRGWG